MISTEVVVIGEILGRWDSPVASTEERENMTRTLGEIASGFDCQFMDYDGRSHPLKVQWLRTPQEYLPLDKIREPLIHEPMMPPSFIKFTCRLEYTDEYIDGYLTPSDPADDHRIPRYDVEQLIATDTSKDLAGVFLDTVIAANIARLGSLNYTRIFHFVDDELKAVDDGIRGIPGDVTDQAIERGWPTFNELSVHQVARWLYGVPRFLSRESSTRLGRALAAASHILTSNWSWSELDLAWALLGLEALYADGNSGLQQQLADKTEVFLGRRATHKSGMSSMYNFRSRFLHGDIDLLYAHNLHNQSDRYTRIQNPLYESEFTAIAVLFSTLQRMCMENRYELRFGYQVHDRPDSENAAR